MSVLVQRLGRLRGAYPALLRLSCNSGNHPRRVLGVLPRYRCSTPSAAWIESGKTRGFTVPAAADVADDIYIGPERIPENTYARNLFLNSLKYANTMLRPSTAYAYVTNDEALEILERDWSSMTDAEIVSAVKRLSYNVSHNKGERLESLKYAKPFNTLNLRDLTDDNLMTVMRHLVAFSSHMVTCDFYYKLCERIDKECMKRFLQLHTDNILYLCDVIYQISPRSARNSQYIWYSVRNLGNRPHKLSPHQLVQVLFFLNVCRKPPINMYEIEYQLERCMNELSINELAVAALGFFKTRSKIRSTDFLNRIIRRTIAEIDVVNTVSIASIVKLVRYSTTLSEIKELLVLLKVLTQYEPQYTLMSLAHIAQAYGRIAIYNKELIDRIIRRLNKEIKTARIKDFERFLYAFYILNIDSSNSVYQNVINELRATWYTTRAREIARFPYVVSRILGYLAIQNIYPIDLVKRVMASEYINKTCNGNYHQLSREYIVLDYSLRIEVPEYDGPFLKPTTCSLLEKKFYEYFLKTGGGQSTRANILLTNVLETCQELFNTTSDISVIRALPHFTTQDIVFCIDEQNQLVPSEKFLSQYESNDIKPVDKNSGNVRWIALVMGHHGLLIRNCNTPTGSLTAKIRQLSVIGYTPIMITHSSWDACKSSHEKRDYLKNLVFRNNTSKLSNTT